ncbi:M14 family zinc carboxypeptidase [Gilvibacter sp.]|uniref:M14 family zinc carboxypeptidase n=1 Tax=Gilvibacter sp. TaxID=2729997 RepID=UPI003F4A14F2
MEFNTRYLAPDHILTALKSLTIDPNFSLDVLGKSAEGRHIYGLKFGSGSKRILLWSQMHGNETTTTKALLHYLQRLVNSEKGAQLAKHLQLFIIPMLNPDGAATYTRLNANDVDLNRDALDLSQPESIVFREVFNAFKPELCLNLHGQRSIYGLTGSENPAVLSFLAPAADSERTITPARLEAMRLINSITEALHEDIGQQIGRYDDTFNNNCLGDYCTQQGIPTILFEAGQFGPDYSRNNTAALIEKAYAVLFDQLCQPVTEVERNSIVSCYLDLPENQVNYCDLILKNVLPIAINDTNDLFIQYRELLVEGSIRFEAEVFGPESLEPEFAHRYENDTELNSELKRLNQADWPPFIADYVLKKYSH